MKVNIQVVGKKYDQTLDKRTIKTRIEEQKDRKGIRIMRLNDGNCDVTEHWS